jgi:hypothetical protein
MVMQVSRLPLRLKQPTQPPYDPRVVPQVCQIDILVSTIAQAAAHYCAVGCPHFPEKLRNFKCLRLAEVASPVGIFLDNEKLRLLRRRKRMSGGKEAGRRIAVGRATIRGQEIRSARKANQKR